MKHTDNSEQVMYKMVYKLVVYGVFLGGSIVLLLPIKTQAISQQTMVLNFDSPFPATPTKQVIDSCMKLYGSIEHIYYDRQESALTDLEMAQKVCAGDSIMVPPTAKLIDQVIRLDSAVDLLFTQQNTVIPTDLEYIVDLFEHIRRVHATVLGKTDDVVVVRSRSMLAGIHGKLQTLLQSYNPLIGAGH